MHEHGYKEDPEELAKAQEQGYEHRDVDSSRVGRAGIIFAVFTILSIVVALGAMKAIYWIQNRDSLAYQSSPEPRKKLPPGPLLQSNTSTKEDILKLRTAETQRLSTSGIDPTTGKRHIPIEEAIDLLAQRGLPVSSAPARAAASPDAVRPSPPVQKAPDAKPEVLARPTQPPPAPDRRSSGPMRPQSLSTSGLKARIAPAMRGEETR